MRITPVFVALSVLLGTVSTFCSMKSARADVLTDTETGIEIGGEDYFYQYRWQTSYLRDLGFDNNIQNQQGGGYGVRGSLMISPPIFGNAL